MNTALVTARSALASERQIRVMIVDDAVVARSIVTRWVEAEPDMKVAASLRTGREALDKLEAADPDVVLLDVEMPELDGIAALPLLLGKKRDLVVIMVSTLTRRSAELSLRALALGATDYVPKPETTYEAMTSAAFHRELIDKVRGLGRKRLMVRKSAPVSAREEKQPPRDHAPPPRVSDGAPRRADGSEVSLRPFAVATPRALLIGSSTGGPQALTVLVEKLPAAIDRAPMLDYAAHAADFHRGAGRTLKSCQRQGRARSRARRAGSCRRHLSGARRPPYARRAQRRRRQDRARRRLAGQLLQTGGRSFVFLGGGGVEIGFAWCRSHRHGQRRHARRHRHCRRRRQRHRAGRGDQRCLGYAAIRRPGRLVLGRPPAQPDCRQNTWPVFGRSVVTPLDYDYLRKSLKQRSGLVLSADKQYLVESRLLPVARKAGLVNLTALVNQLKRGDEALMTAVVEAMATNESFFFRDKVPFYHFTSIIMPALIAARRNTRTIRIWCAAASIGQEPYSLAMCLKEMESDLAGWRVELLASDLSGEALEKARQGLYTQFEVQRGLPIQFLVRYFKQTRELWQIAPEIRAMVKFRQLNLLSDFSHLGIFDLIFCRNVLIYFDPQTKVDVLDRLAWASASDGYLVLGAAETVVGLTESFKVVGEKHGLYAPNARSPRPSLPAAGKPAARLVAAGGGQ